MQQQAEGLMFWMVNTMTKTKAEREHMTRVADLGCIVCLNEHGEASPAELHHVNANGMGLRSDNYSVIPLCPAHHRAGSYGVAIHAGKRTWEEKFGAETELLKQVRGLIDGR